MDRPNDITAGEPLLVKKVGDTRRVERSGQLRKRSGDLKLKREQRSGGDISQGSMDAQKTRDEDQTDESSTATITNTSGGAAPVAPSGFVRKSVSEARGIQMTPVRIDKIEPPTPVQHGSTKRRSPPSSGSPIGNILNNSSSAGRPVNTDTIDICVYFADGQGLEFPMRSGKQAEASYLLRLTANQISINSVKFEEAFSLWMASNQLEVQLKPHHPPYEVRRQWSIFLKKYTMANDDQILSDEPTLMVRRNVMLTLERERELMEDVSICRLLFEDARSQFLTGRYSFECRDAAHMAGLSMAVVLGPCPDNVLETLRKEIEEHLPARHLASVRGPMVFGRALSGTKELEEVVLKAWREAGSDKVKAMKAFLARTSQSPCYGAAFFSGSIERPNASLKAIKSWFTSSGTDIKVRVGINLEWVCVAEESKGELLLAQPIEDCTWRKIEPSEQHSEEAETSLLLHFPEDPLPSSEDSDRGSDGDDRKSRQKSRFRKTSKTNTKTATANAHTAGNETKLLQIFGPQAILMDALLNAMQDLSSKRPAAVRNTRSSSPDEGVCNDSYEPSSASSNEGRRHVGRQPSLTKGNRMCLATFDAEGRCLSAQGSLKKVLVS